MKIDTHQSCMGKVPNGNLTVFWVIREPLISDINMTRLGLESKARQGTKDWKDWKAKACKD